MTAKQYLSQIRRYDIKINFDLMELEHWRDLSTKISGSNFEPHYNASRNTEAPFARCVEQIIDLQAKINREIDELIDMKNKAIGQIHKLENLDYQAILELRYIGYKTWEEIADKLNYSLRWVYKMHGLALIEFEKNMEE